MNTKTIAENILARNTEQNPTGMPATTERSIAYSLAWHEAELTASELDHDWRSDTTTVTFNDGSQLAFCDGDVTVIK